MQSFPKIVGHRGERDKIPENTVPSIQSALELRGRGGAMLHGVEFDVELPKSGRAVCLHQETLVLSPDGGRVVLADRNFTTRDWVSERTSDEIAELDAGTWMNPKFAGLRVPRLDEVLALPWGGCTAYVELKDPTYWGTRDLSWPARIVAGTISELAAFDGKLDVISFNPEILRELGRRLPHIPRTLALWTEWQSRREDAVAEARSAGAGTLLLADVMVLEQPEWLRHVHDAGLALYVYPVSPARGEPEFENYKAELQKPKWSRLHEIGIDAIFTDFPRETLEFFHGRADS